MPHFYTRCISLPFDSYFDLFYAPQLLLFGPFRVVSVAEVNKAAALVVQASADFLNEKAAADQCLPGERKERGKVTRRERKTKSGPKRKELKMV